MLKRIRFCMSSIGVVCVLLLGATAFAAPICPVPVEFTQPNGDVITVTSYGDEFFSWKEDENGNVITYNEESRSYKYAEIKDNEIIPTSQTVGESSLFSMFSHKLKREDMIPLWENAERIDYSKSIEDNEIQLMSANNETTDKKLLTDQALLTILIEFNDIEMKFDSKFWSDQMFSNEPGALSVVNYWKENSGGKNIFKAAETSSVKVGDKGVVSHKDYSNIPYEIKECYNGVVRIRFDIPHPVKMWKDKENPGKKTMQISELAVRAIENSFNFENETPHVISIFSGYDISGGEGAGKGEIHGHTTAGGIETSNGVQLGRFVIQGEMMTDNIPEGIGTTCHELGHSVFFLPDLYFSFFSGEMNGLALYSLMCIGNQGQGFSGDGLECDDPYAGYLGHVPTHLDPWCKIQCGFVTPEVVVDDWNGDINSIPKIDTDNPYNIVKVMSNASPSQYFLIENRQLIGFDKGLERLNFANYGGANFSGGILIYHVDEGVFTVNNNNAEYHRFLSIEGSNNTYGASVWTYTNKAGYNQFNAATAPNSNFHQKKLAATYRCENFKDCHPQNVPSGISIEVLNESSPSMQVSVKIDDEHKIETRNDKFSDVFRDENFCNAVIEMLDNENGGKRTPDSIISVEDWIKINNLVYLDIDGKGIKDLSGIDVFTNMDTITCNNNELTELSLTQDMEFIECNNNKLTKIDLSNCNSLFWLQCENNLLTELDVSNCMPLELLYCSGNQLTQLDISKNTKLEDLECYNNFMDKDASKSIKVSDNSLIDISDAESAFVYYPQKTAEPSPTPTAEPSLTPTIEPTPITSPSPTLTPELKDRVEFERQEDNTISAKLIFEKTTPPAENNIMLIVAYRENGQLKRVEVPEISDMTASFDYQACDIAVYVWDKNMKPLMNVQNLILK